MSSFEGNSVSTGTVTAVTGGGAVSVHGGTVHISETSFTGNAAVQGGALRVSAAAVSVTSCQFDSNR